MGSLVGWLNYKQLCDQNKTKQKQTNIDNVRDNRRRVMLNFSRERQPSLFAYKFLSGLARNKCITFTQHSSCYLIKSGAINIFSYFFFNDGNTQFLKRVEEIRKRISKIIGIVLSGTAYCWLRRLREKRNPLLIKT